MNPKPNPKPTSKRRPYFHGPLYQRMTEDLHLTGKAPRTVSGYLRAVRQLTDYCQTTPDQITEQQLRQFFRHLKNERHFAYGSLRVALSGVKFFYSVTCLRDWDVLSLLKLKNVSTLPEVLTRQQVRQIINATTTQRMNTFFWTVYSLGLRLNEALHLQTGDIDGGRMMVHIHRGKGAKDRYIPLPQTTLQRLRNYWVTHRHPRLLFPADGRDHRLQTGNIAAIQTPMSETAVQGAIKQITRAIDFGKKISIHTLRHCYATHLLEAGVSLKVIQQYLGHSSLTTTLIYLHLTDTATENARQVIERMFHDSVDPACVDPDSIDPTNRPSGS